MSQVADEKEECTKLRALLWTVLRTVCKVWLPVILGLTKALACLAWGWPGGTWGVARGGGGRRPVQRDLTTMSVLKEESQLHFHGIPSAAVDDLALARVALGVVLQELHDFSPDCLKDTAWHTHVQKHLQSKQAIHSA